MFVVTVIFLAGFVFVSQSFGDCKRTCNGYVKIHYDYKEKGKENYRKNSVSCEVISAQGIYGSGCTPVRIKKAKNRAADEIKKIAKRKYEGKAEVQQNALCQKIPYNIKQIAQYFQIDFIQVNVYHKDTNSKFNPFSNSGHIIKSFRIPAANSAKFICK